MKKRIFLLVEKDVYGDEKKDEKKTGRPDKFHARQIICAVSPDSECFRPDTENAMLACIKEKLGGEIVASKDRLYGESYCLEFRVGEKGNNRDRRFAVLEVPFIDEETKLVFGEEF